jgi:hypothetical protein
VVGDEEDVVPFWNSVARSPRVSPSAHGLDRVATQPGAHFGGWVRPQTGRVESEFGLARPVATLPDASVSGRTVEPALAEYWIKE